MTDRQTAEARAREVLGRLDMNDYESVTAKNLDLILAEWARDVLALSARVVELERERDEIAQKLGAATTMLAEAEKIVPGVITTVGRFSLGLNDRERAEAAEDRVAALEEALEWIYVEPEDPIKVQVWAAAALRAAAEPEETPQ